MRVEPVGLDVDPADAYPILRRFPAPFFLDASDESRRGSRLSFLGAEPCAWLEYRGGRVRTQTHGPWKDFRGDPFGALEELVARGGIAVGYISYDLGRGFEAVGPHRSEDLPFPDLRFGLYRAVLAHDGTDGRWELRKFDGETPPGWLGDLGAAPAGSASSSCQVETWVPATPRPEYLSAVRRAKEYIRQGEIYQVNLSQRFSAPFSGDPWPLYRRLRRMHPAAYGAYLETDSEAILCLSPELFLRRDGDRIQTDPIKGTRPRSSDPEGDLIVRSELERSEKDRAELNMIVDLERNDLGRICRAGTVAVLDPRRIESYATVHHAVATIQGRVRSGAGLAEILRASFPGGSITGCPKIRSMQILSELEPFARGPYTGSIGWIWSQGDFCLNIVIRTLLADRQAGRIHLNVGGGIVADSDPDLEYEETLHKGSAFLRLAGARF